MFYGSLTQLGGAADVALMLAALGLNLHQEATRGGAIGQRFLVPQPSGEQLRTWADMNYSENLADRDKKVDRFVTGFDVHRDPDLCVELLNLQYSLNALGGGRTAAAT